MDRDRIIKSIAYCGLICELCHQANECDGCKSEKNNCGKHLSDAGCFQRMCCIKKNINGCWECDNFPCDKDMYNNNHDPKIKAFARCIKEDGHCNGYGHGSCIHHHAGRHYYLGDAEVCP